MRIGKPGVYSSQNCRRSTTPGLALRVQPLPLEHVFWPLSTAENCLWLLRILLLASLT